MNSLCVVVKPALILERTIAYRIWTVNAHIRLSTRHLDGGEWPLWFRIDLACLIDLQGLRLGLCHELLDFDMFLYLSYVLASCYSLSFPMADCSYYNTTKHPGLLQVAFNKELEKEERKVTLEKKKATKAAEKEHKKEEATKAIAKVERNRLEADANDHTPHPLPKEKRSGNTCRKHFLPVIPDFQTEDTEAEAPPKVKPKKKSFDEGVKEEKLKMQAERVSSKRSKVNDDVSFI